jgi:hypothetical protein
MQKIFRILASITLGIVVACVLSCKKDPVTICGVATTAEFTIEESFTTQGNRGLLNTYVETDTVVLEHYIRLTAVDSLADSYEWTIGNDPRKETGRIAYVYFGNPENIIVTLKVKKRPVLECFPNDKGVDTVSHRLVAVDFLKSLVIGKYEGYLESKPNEIFVVDFSYEPTYGDIILKNMPQGCIKFPVSYQSVVVGYRAFVQPEQTLAFQPCNKSYGVGVLQGNDKRKLVFPFGMYHEDVKGIVKDKFIGIKK